MNGNPDNGAVLSSAPAQLDAYFAEDIVRQAGTYGLKVTSSAGVQVDNQDTAVDDANRRQWLWIVHLDGAQQCSAEQFLYDLRQLFHSEQ